MLKTKPTNKLKNELFLQILAKGTKNGKLRFINCEYKLQSKLLTLYIIIGSAVRPSGFAAILVKMSVSTFRLAAILVIMSVSTLKSAVILYVFIISIIYILYVPKRHSYKRIFGGFLCIIVYYYNN